MMVLLVVNINVTEANFKPGNKNKKTFSINMNKKGVLIVNGTN
jgi:hypothetical protein